MPNIGWRFVQVPDDLQFNILRALLHRDGLTADEVEEVLGPHFMLSISLGPHRMEQCKKHGWVRSDNEFRYFLTEEGRKTFEALSTLKPKH